VKQHDVSHTGHTCRKAETVYLMTPYFLGRIRDNKSQEHPALRNESLYRIIEIDTPTSQWWQYCSLRFEDGAPLLTIVHFDFLVVYENYIPFGIISHSKLWFTAFNRFSVLQLYNCVKITVHTGTQMPSHMKLSRQLLSMINIISQCKNMI